MKRPPSPPWLRDPHPQNWCDVALAAKVYFRKSLVTVKRYIKTGYLEELGIPSYWDGTRWHVRLPEPILRERKPRKEQNARVSG